MVGSRDACKLRTHTPQQLCCHRYGAHRVQSECEPMTGEQIQMTPLLAKREFCFADWISNNYNLQWNYSNFPKQRCEQLL